MSSPPLNEATILTFADLDRYKTIPKEDSLSKRKQSNPEPPSHSHYFSHHLNPIYIPPGSNNRVGLKRSLSDQRQPSLPKELPSSFVASLTDDEYDRGIGRLKWNSNDIIGRGSGGTLVYKGAFDGVSCAVKCLVKAYWPKYEAEIQKLLFICMERDDLPSSIVRYYGKEEDPEKMYLALELCTQTLAQLMENSTPESFPVAAKLSGLRDVCDAVRFLHERNIVHNDINPRNILQSKGKLKLADLGLSKWVSDDHSSYTFSSDAGPVGAGGWYAKEILLEERKTRKVDIFSLGVVIHYTLTHGVNPFGDKFYSYVNIRDGRKPVLPEKLSPPPARHLIAQMIDHDPSHRPTIESVMEHPLFWAPTQCLDFIRRVSNVVDQASSSLKYDVEEILRENIKMRSWREAVDEVLWKHLTLHRPYIESSFTHLVRAVRNLYEHWNDLPSKYPAISELFDENTDGLFAYFNKRFPSLVLALWLARAKLMA